MYDTTVMDTCHTFDQIHRKYNIESESQGHIWNLGIMMCQCRFITCNKCTTLVVGVDVGGGYVCMGEGDLWESSVPSFQFYCELKTDLKK